MTTGFIDFRIRVEKKRAGDFAEDLATFVPYAQCVGITVAIPALKALPAPAAPSKPTVNSEGLKLTHQQQTILTLIESGLTTREAIEEHSGMKNALRVLNNLKRFKIIRGNDTSGYVSITRDE
jgi:hypothetical protein